MEKIFADIPTNLTPSVMAALGEQLRGCSSELARIGAPSARLQPVHALVEKACGEYDEGAQCFATAAGIGIPFAGTAAEREQTLALECGFAASEGIIPLADALNQGAEITFSRLKHLAATVRGSIPSRGSRSCRRRRSCTATQRATVGTLRAALTTAIREG
jgi:hypothetical protein